MTRMTARQERSWAQRGAVAAFALLLAACAGSTGEEDDVSLTAGEELVEETEEEEEAADDAPADDEEGDDGDDAGEDAADEGAGDLDGTSINFFHWRGEDRAVFDELAADFTAETGVEVEQTIMPSDQYQSTAQVQLDDGTVGDVFTAFRGAQFVSIAEAGIYEDLAEYDFVERYVENLLEPGQLDGTQYGLPYQLVFNMPVYNKTMFDELGLEPPTDWDGFLEMCDTLRESGVDPIAWPGGDPANSGQLLNAMTMNNAPADDIYEQIEAGDASLDDQWWIDTLAQYEEMAARCFQEQSLGTNTEAATTLWAVESAAILPTGTFHIGAAREQGAEFEVGLLAPITTSEADATYDGIYNATFVLGINSNSQNKEGAAAWLEYLSRPDVAEAYAAGTTQHLTVDGLDYENEDLAATADWITANTLLAPRFQWLNLQARDAWENSVIAVLGGDEPAAAAAEAQSLLEEALAE